MPRLIYGTAWQEERTENLVYKALRIGFRGIDTACQPKNYNERLVGNALKMAFSNGIDRSTVFVQTKFTPVEDQGPGFVPYDANKPLAGQVLESFSISARNLGVSYIDSLLLHNPLRKIAETKLVWRAFESLYERQSVYQLGLSNFSKLEVLEELYDYARIKPSVLQNSFSRNADYYHKIKSFCLRHNIIYQCYWALSSNEDILAHPEVVAIARKLGKTTPQILYAFLLNQKLIPIIGTASTAHMKEDIAVCDFELTCGHVDRMFYLLFNRDRARDDIG